jgi:carbamoyltransferase
MPYEHIPNMAEGENHDASAALLVDGEIVSAIEEERLNRIKHTNKFPSYAIQAVLCDRGLSLEDVDLFCCSGSEEFLETHFRISHYRDSSQVNLLSPREFLGQLFKKAFDFDLDETRICFVDHHIAHAACSFYLSGFDKSLIVTLDAVGERISGRVLYGGKNEMKAKHSISEINSLGHYYVWVSKFIGYDLFDEYKVMGLAPYGNPAKYRELFSKFYKLLPQGKFEIYRDYIHTLLFDIGNPRRKGQPFDQLYMDVAASLQESIETIILHILEYYSQTSGFDKLCLAGGVAHNCSANGKILSSGLFKEIFVQPASHDGGNSIGAAVYTYLTRPGVKEIKKLEHVYIGTQIEGDTELSRILEGWKSFIYFSKEKDIERKAAEVIYSGKVIGWVQGRSEFGPRALGNRSILADPRPPENKDIINRMVKKREAYRPFAPSVIEEKAGDYFEVSLNGTNLDFMTFAVDVKKQYQQVLGAVTHVDGTARIQTVSKTQNPRYWNLINEFGKLSGIPILLNTSFNNNVEPIVNTAEDAIVCFLTTGLDHLVIGDYLISKENKDLIPAIDELVVSLLQHTVIHSRKSFDSAERVSVKQAIGFNYSTSHDYLISKGVFELLSRADGKTSLRDLLLHQHITHDDLRRSALKEMEELWKRRYIRLSPALFNKICN